jgi:hypothetical protein
MVQARRQPNEYVASTQSARSAPKGAGRNGLYKNGFRSGRSVFERAFRRVSKEQNWHANARHMAFRAGRLLAVTEEEQP